MKLHLAFPLTLAALILSGCGTFSPAATATPDFNAVSTALFEQVFLPLTQTAAAAPPTPTITLTPTPTQTLTPEPTTPIRRPLITANTSCWAGPGEEYKLISHVPAKRYVELLGIGSVPGWYIISNPYFRTPCWIEAIYLQLDPRMDTSAFPTMMPGAKK